MLLVIAITTACAPACPKLDGKAPDFTLETLGGNKANLKDYQGKTVLLTFWATWCTYCRYQLPFIQVIYDKYSNSGLTVLAVNVKESYAKAANYIKEEEFTFPVLLDKEGKISQQYCVPGLPSTIIIDAQGMVKVGKVGAFQNAEEIESALASLR